MKEEFENELSTLLTQHFGVDWEINWEDEDDGFSLKLEVFNQDQKEHLNPKIFKDN